MMIKTRLAHEGIKLNTLDLTRSCEYLEDQLSEKYLDEIADTVDEYFKDLILSIKKELKKPKNDRDILTYN